jgi:hypothetical protein
MNCKNCGHSAFAHAIEKDTWPVCVPYFIDTDRHGVCDCEKFEP